MKRKNSTFKLLWPLKMDILSANVFNDLKGDKKFFLCTLSAKKRKKGHRTCYNMHAEECMLPMFPASYNCEDSFDYRYKQ